MINSLDHYTSDAAGRVRRWVDELQIAGKWQEPWEKRAREIVRRYEGALAPGKSTSFNILHSNVETLRPALLGAVPQPDVRRRGKLPGEVDREAGEVIEMALRYLNDTTDYMGQGKAMVTDYLLTGRMTGRVRYTPTIVRRQEPVLKQIGVDGAPQYFTANMNEVDAADVLGEGEDLYAEIEELQFERADMEHVAYNDFRHNPARAWRDVRWCAFRHYFSYHELKDAFGKARADRTTLDTAPSVASAAQSEDGAQPDLFNKAEVWEIWDKVDRKILFMAPGNAVELLGEFEPGPESYDFREFFCCPEPLRSIGSPASLLPIPEFVIYQDLADELDDVTEKIRRIIETVDVRGAYDGAVPELGQIFDQATRLVPVEQWRALTDKGGLAGVMDFVPIDPQVKAFVALAEQRKLLLDTIYQTVGLSDIARASSDPRETATAQRLKGQASASRISPRQRDVQGYMRDLMRLQAELVAEKFETDTLHLMTGIEITPEIETLLRVDALRAFSIDIETDSTIAIDDAATQEALGGLLEALAAMQRAAQALPGAARMPFMLSVVRKFKLGRDVELAIEEAAQQPPEPDPEAEAMQADMQLRASEIQQKDAASQLQYEIDLQELALKARDIAAKEGKNEADVMLALGQLFAGGGGGDA